MVSAACGSALILLAAFGFQHLGGLAPCPLCVWQRWPHAMGVVIGAGALLFPVRALAVLGMLAMVTAAVLGLYHTGIERDWWAGPSSCTGTGLGGMSGADLLDPSAAGRLVMCDEVVWSFLGLSMASWNAALALCLSLLWAAAALRE